MDKAAAQIHQSDTPRSAAGGGGGDGSVAGSGSHRGAGDEEGAEEEGDQDNLAAEAKEG